MNKIEKSAAMSVQLKEALTGHAAIFSFDVRSKLRGLDGTCGENGSHLSGGKRQRIALARALARGVQVLILDEGVSAIDVATANEIGRELLGMKDLTLLTVTHRIKDGLIEQYDRVMLMQDGQIVERRL